MQGSLAEHPVFTLHRAGAQWLTSPSLSGWAQDSIAHEVLSRAKQLHWTWTACNELAVAAINGWPHLLPRLQREWCSLFLRAAEAARTMQRRCLSAG